MKTLYFSGQVVENNAAGSCATIKLLLCHSLVRSVILITKSMDQRFAKAAIPSTSTSRLAVLVYTFGVTLTL